MSKFGHSSYVCFVNYRSGRTELRGWWCHDVSRWCIYPWLALWRHRVFRSLRFQDASLCWGTRGSLTVRASLRHLDVQDSWITWRHGHVNNLAPFLKSVFFNIFFVLGHDWRNIWERLPKSRIIFPRNSLASGYLSLKVSYSDYCSDVCSVSYKLATRETALVARMLVLPFLWR